MKSNGYVLLSVLVVLMMYSVACGGSDGLALIDGAELSSEACTSRNLENVVLVIHSEQCPACRAAVPVLEEIEQEYPDIEFVFMEVTKDATVLDELEFTSGYIPAIVADCKVSTGKKTKAEYLDILGVSN